MGRLMRMSLKPKKASELKRDQERLNNKMAKKKKNLLDKLPPYTFIISEGTKTEVTYMAGFANVINEKYRSFSTGNRIIVKGTGRNCQSLLNYARMIVEKEMPQATQVWLMYDKDDFPFDDFDNTQYSAEQRKDSRKYKVAWSNESLELWFVLHFQELHVNIGRKAYIRILEEKCNYKKNDPKLFQMFRGNMDTAIMRAKRQYTAYADDVPPSKSCPATRVFELVEELKAFL